MDQASDEGAVHGRRTFIVGATAATVTVAAGGFGGYRLLKGNETPANRALAADEVDYDLLLPMTGGRLGVATSTGTFAAAVTSVSEPVSYTAGGVSGSSFSMILESSERLDQGTYDFTHDETGTFPMFVVPVDPPAGGNHTYQAVFNRLN